MSVISSPWPANSKCRYGLKKTNILEVFWLALSQVRLTQFRTKSLFFFFLGFTGTIRTTGAERRSGEWTQLFFASQVKFDWTKLASLLTLGAADLFMIQ